MPRSRYLLSSCSCDVFTDSTWTTRTRRPESPETLPDLTVTQPKPAESHTERHHWGGINKGLKEVTGVSVCRYHFVRDYALKHYVRHFSENGEVVKANCFIRIWLDRHGTADLANAKTDGRLVYSLPESDRKFLENCLSLMKKPEVCSGDGAIRPQADQPLSQLTGLSSVPLVDKLTGTAVTGLPQDAQSDSTSKPVPKSRRSSAASASSATSSHLRRGSVFSGRGSSAVAKSPSHSRRKAKRPTDGSL